MQLSRVLLTLALGLAPIALLSTTWLYLYPIFHGCAFPVPPDGGEAPFRLLALGDPQLEGDSSLPDPNAPVFPSLRYVLQDLRYAPTIRQRVEIVTNAAQGVVTDGKKWAEGKRKAIDLWGNDWYLAHIVRQTRWWSQPSHVAVLGDLLGSQWITDGEFEKRAGRYWGRVMRGLEGVPGVVFGVEEQLEEDTGHVEGIERGEEIKEGREGGELIVAIEEESRETIAHGDEDRREESEPEEQKEEHNAEHQEEEQHKPLRKPSWGGTTEVLGADEAWAKRVINIAGNHDVGYAGDLDVSRIARFEKAFGSVNWDIWFTLPPDNKTTSIDTPPALRIVVLNSMNIDAPAWNHELQTETYEFMNHIITNSRDVSDKTHATILLTHIPLEKQSGVCVDSPLFNYFDDGQGLREQNMLSEHSSKTILQGVFGMSDNPFVAGQGFGRRGIVLNGHDHEGCDTMHFIPQEGVYEQCNIDTVKSEEAYWPTPTPTLTPTPNPTTSVAPEAYDLSPANPLASDATCDMIIPVEPPPLPTPTHVGWRAYRFPHLPYSITHDPFTNTTSCTAITKSPHIREITLRSMMGDFSGHAGFLSAWFDAAKGEKGEWIFEFASCGVGVQHWWWGVHSLDFAVVVVGVLAGVVSWFEGRKCEEKKGINGRMNGKMSGR